MTETDKTALPQFSGKRFLTDGGIETTLIFHEGFELPCFAAYLLLDSAEGRKCLRDYYRRFINIAAETGSGFVLESPTWRCSRDWGKKLGHDEAAIERYNREAIALMAGAARGCRIWGPVCDIRLHRSARGWLCAGSANGAGRSGGLPLPPGRSVRRHRDGHGDRGDNDPYRRGSRPGARSRACRSPGRDIVHARNGRRLPSASRSARPFRRWTKRQAGLPPIT